MVCCFIKAKALHLCTRFHPFLPQGHGSSKSPFFTLLSVISLPVGSSSIYKYDVIIKKNSSLTSTPLATAPFSCAPCIKTSHSPQTLPFHSFLKILQLGFSLHIPHRLTCLLSRLPMTLRCVAVSTGQSPGLILFDLLVAFDPVDTSLHLKVGHFLAFRTPYSPNFPLINGDSFSISYCWVLFINPTFNIRVLRTLASSLLLYTLFLLGHTKSNGVKNTICMLVIIFLFSLDLFLELWVCIPSCLPQTLFG